MPACRLNEKYKKPIFLLPMCCEIGYYCVHLQPTRTYSRQSMENDTEIQKPLVDFGPVEDTTKGIIKVVGVGGGGCNAVDNMYEQNIADVTFAAINTDSKALAKTKVPTKLPIGDLGAGGDPKRGREKAQNNIENIKRLFSDGTRMTFVTAGMGGGTGTGAAPIVAGVAKQMGILTIGVVTIPFFFEKKDKIVKALKGVEQMRRNVDALLIVNNERICDIYSDSDMSVSNAFKHADKILSDAARSISEIITTYGTINLDFCDVETTMRGGGGAIMAIGRGSGAMRVENAIVDALDSPLLYGCDIGKAQRILFNIYTNEQAKPLLVNELRNIDGFMDALDPNIKVIWGVSNDSTLKDDAKVTILATGFDEDFKGEPEHDAIDDESHYDELIRKLYKPYKKKVWTLPTDNDTPDGKPTGADDMPPLTIDIPGNPETADNGNATTPTGNGDAEKAKPSDGEDTHTERDTSSKPRKPETFLERARRILQEKMEELMTDE